MSIYRHESGNSNSLSHSNISPLLQDSQGILWVGTENGLNRKNPGSEEFIHYPLELDEPNPDFITPYQWVWSLLEDSEGQIWVGTLGGGLLRYDRSKDRFIRIRHDPDDPDSLPNDAIRSMTEDLDGNLWVGTGRGLARLLDLEPPRFERFDFMELFPEQNLTHVTALNVDQAGNLWAGLDQAVVVKPADSETFQFIHHDPSDPASLGSGRVWTIFEDISGVLWVLTDSISWLVPSLNAFSLYPQKLSLTDEDHLALDSSNRLWTGGRSGLIGLDLDLGEWSNHIPEPDAERIGANRIKGAGIYEDDIGRIWVSTPSRLNQFDPESGTFEFIDLPAEPNAMVLGSDGLMWMALPFKGLGALNVETNDLQIFAPDESDPTSVSHRFGYAVHEDSKGRLWYGTQHGLNLFDRSSGKATRYFNSPGDATSLSNNTVRQIFEDQSGQLWFGTQFGLNLLNGDEGFIRHFNGEEATDNVFSSIVSFGDNYLWLATDRGIARFDTTAGGFTNYSSADGLPPNFRQILQAGDNGILYTVTPAGFLAIDTKQLEFTPHPPPVVLTDFRLFNQPVGIAPKVCQRL
jgi:ligand-binding sensor domain-containing protein